MYLHFRSRTWLFLCVLMRESLGLVGELVAAVRRDPAAVQVAERARLTYLAVQRRPLMRALFAVVPQLQVLGRTAVFVTHGGMNSALERLANGVPLVVLPQQIEQLLIGRSIADRGAGVVLRHNLSGRPVPPGELRAAAERALTDPSRRAAATALARTVGEGGGAPAGADAIQHLLTHLGAADT